MKAGFNWVDSLDGPARDAVLMRSTLRKVSGGTVLYNVGDDVREVFQVVSGQVRMFALSEAGTAFLIHQYAVGDVVADTSAIDREPLPVTLVAHGQTTLRTWSVTNMEELSRQYPSVASSLARQVSLRLRSLVRLLLDLVTLPVSARVASRIAALYEFQSCPGSGITLSQSDLSLMVGSTRQSVNEVIQILKVAKLIETRYGKIDVLDIQGLRNYVRSECNRA